jgi:8-oxo-dGTP pyrophosphatase MutT (NUDIX family)
VTAVEGVVVDVWRRRGGMLEFLVLHRALWGAGFDGDWAWSTPGGGLAVGEDALAGARRELEEETGLHLELVPTSCGRQSTTVFSAEAPAEAAIRLSPEHDRYEWLTLREARARCLPTWANEHLPCVARALGDDDE